MTNEEYIEFLKYVISQYIIPRLDKMRRHWMHHPMYFGEWDYQWRRLRDAIALANLIYSLTENRDIYDIFKPDGVGKIIGDIKDGVNLSKNMAEDGGFLDALNNHYDEIIEGLTIDLFPEGELMIFHDLGAKDPKSELQGILYLLKVRAKKASNLQKEASPQHLLERVQNKLTEEEEQFKAEKAKEQPPQKSRRWFKGLGKIGQGAGLSIADIGLAAGIIKFPVSAETASLGALASVISGYGLIMDGIGELRGE